MSSETATSPPAPPPRAVRHPLLQVHFRNLWAGSTISLLGDQFYLVAMPWLVLQITSSSLALGGVLMTTAIPRAALMLVGGAMTDRFSARRVLMVTAAVRAVLVGIVAGLIALKVVALWHVYLLTFAFGVADAFSLPSGSALIPTLVEPEQLRPANAFMQGSAVMTQMVGPAPAGLLVKLSGIAGAFFFDALSFLAVIAALLRIPDPPRAGTGAAADGTPAPAPARPGMLRSIGDGLRAVRQDPPLLSLMAVIATINICVAGPIVIGLAAMAKFRFGSAAAFGTLLSCFSAGTLVGLIAGGTIKRPRRRGLQFIVMSGLAGLELISIGLVQRLVPIGILLAVMGLGVGFVNVQFSAWLQLRVDRAILGRVMSVLMFAAVGLVPLSYAVAGMLAQWSLKALFVLAGAVLAAASAVALASPAARHID